MDKPELTTCSNDELLAELLRRFDAAVFIGEIDRSGADTRSVAQYQGSTSRILGMLDIRRETILEAERARVRAAID